MINFGDVDSSWGGVAAMVDDIDLINVQVCVVVVIFSCEEKLGIKVGDIDSYEKNIVSEIFYWWKTAYVDCDGT